MPLSKLVIIYMKYSKALVFTRAIKKKKKEVWKNKGDGDSFHSQYLEKHNL